ncbi:4-hydroxy-tetrahydrodipicolinate synthase [Halobellus ruber]|uniref:4-hydroxy-tetrahydrodipicolinate synthase n=1 Tax=Halobellus ruber TaxID=2761102 RepID=A0A7J9SIV0_9EURY|nr:4-hydroxy-tetrahydrodipicolinate synthase [Halobellus ruber]MBB6645907.1 4-hydroxy-tetrahydrodipicolinate synthase [Halobellus ruber]
MTEVTEGVFPPIVTPFDDDGEVDYESFADNIERLERNGVSGITPCGSTGERSTLRPQEHRDVIEFAVEEASTPVIAGTGSPSTWEVIELTSHAAEVGADAALVHAPYYSAPSDDDIVRHYEEVADAVDIPIVLYNFPAAIGFNTEPDVVVELADHPNIVGIKDSLGDLRQIHELIRRTRDVDFDVLSGWDSLAWPAINAGATGLIGICGNLVPGAVADLVAAATAGDRETAATVHDEILALEDALLVKNPQITVKAALEHLGHAPANVRAPQYPLDDEQTEQVVAAVEAFGYE